MIVINSKKATTILKKTSVEFTERAKNNIISYSGSRSSFNVIWMQQISIYILVVIAGDTVLCLNFFLFLFFFFKIFVGVLFPSYSQDYFDFRFKLNLELCDFTCTF